MAFQLTFKIHCGLLLSVQGVKMIMKKVKNRKLVKNDMWLWFNWVTLKIFSISMNYVCICRLEFLQYVFGLASVNSRRASPRWLWGIRAPYQSLGMGISKFCVAQGWATKSKFLKSNFHWTRISIKFRGEFVDSNTTLIYYYYFYL